MGHVARRMGYVFSLAEKNGDTEMTPTERERERCIAEIEKTMNAFWAGSPPTPMAEQSLVMERMIGFHQAITIIRNMPDPDQEYCEWQTRTVGGKGPYWRTYDTGCGRVMWRNRDDLRYCSCGKPIKVVE